MINGLNCGKDNYDLLYIVPILFMKVYKSINV